MSDFNSYRFAWHDAVMQSNDLTPTAKNVATALAFKFANRKTAQINPPQSKIADYLKVHVDTIKRVMRELRNAGWLIATGDGGRGKAPLLRLLTPGKVLPFPASKGGANYPSQAEKRGDDMCGKGGEITPPHYKDKPSLEPKGGHIPFEKPDVLKQFEKQRFEGNPFDGLRSVSKTDWAALNDWAEWLREQGLPKLCDLPIRQKAERKNAIWFWLPSKTPPTSPRATEDALHFFEALIDWGAISYAAQ